jgi:hexosaminidase
LSSSTDGIDTDVAWPSQSDDEAYTLTIDGSKGSTLYGTGSVWGVLRGLETFSQLFDLESGMIPYSKFVIEDAPRWNYRGLMLDTGRHFVSATHFKALIDGMVYNKFNVLHWHITDDQSFPIVHCVRPRWQDTRRGRI